MKLSRKRPLVIAVIVLIGVLILVVIGFHASESRILTVRSLDPRIQARFALISDGNVQADKLSHTANTTHDYGQLLDAPKNFLHEQVETWMDHLGMADQSPTGQARRMMKRNRHLTMVTPLDIRILWISFQGPIAAERLYPVSLLARNGERYPIRFETMHPSWDGTNHLTSWRLSTNVLPGTYQLVKDVSGEKLFEVQITRRPARKP